MVYLDNSSTTRQAEKVTDLISEIARNDFGNPSSLHSVGLAAEKRVDKAREQIAAALGADPRDIVFDSGGTEADNNIIKGTSFKRQHDGRRVVVSAVEHPAVMEMVGRLEVKGFDVVKVGVKEDGVIDMEEFEDAVNDDTILVSVMTVNNETGAVMPVREIAEIAKKHGAYMHTDAVQAFGKMDLKGITSAVDFVSMSSHKIHGPKGVGAFYESRNTGIRPLIVGGGQEKGRRSGTENVPGIAGFGLAAELATESMDEAYERVAALKKRLLEGLQDTVSDMLVNSTDDGLPYVLNISFLGTRGEVVLHTLEQDGIFVSTGSACSSNKKEKSYVLRAMGRSEAEIEAAIRFSFSRFNTEEEIDFTIDKVGKAVERFRLLGSFR